MKRKIIVLIVTIFYIPAISALDKGFPDEWFKTQTQETPANQQPASSFLNVDKRGRQFSFFRIGGAIKNRSWITVKPGISISTPNGIPLTVAAMACVTAGYCAAKAGDVVEHLVGGDSIISAGDTVLRHTGTPPSETFCEINIPGMDRPFMQYRSTPIHYPQLQKASQTVSTQTENHVQIPTLAPVSLVHHEPISPRSLVDSKAMNIY